MNINYIAIPGIQRAKADPEATILKVCQLTGSSYDQIVSGKGSNHHLCSIRAVIYYVLYNYHGISKSKIASMFNKSAHATVINGLKKYEHWTENNRNFRVFANGIIPFLDLPEKRLTP